MTIGPFAVSSALAWGRAAIPTNWSIISIPQQIDFRTASSSLGVAMVWHPGAGGLLAGRGDFQGHHGDGAVLRGRDLCRPGINLPCGRQVVEFRELEPDGDDV